MNKKFLSLVLSLALAMSAVFLSCAETVYAKAQNERTYGKYVVSGRLADSKELSELSVGDSVLWAASVTLAEDGSVVDNWEKMEPDDILDASIDMDVSKKILFYSSSSSYDADKMTAFGGTIPEKAFGKYIYFIGGIKINEDSSNINNFTFPIRSEGTVTSFVGQEAVTFSLNSSKKSVSVYSIWKCTSAKVPSKVTINGKTYKVTAVKANALKVKTIKSLTLPSTVTTIGKAALKGASKLKKIRIEGNVKSIGNNAFSGINKNATITIKASKANYKKIVKRIKNAGAPSTVTYKRVTK